ncbi:MAG: hypothetical protein LBL94_08655 [Prevotellaceae bacterium]|jgi:hypothetical protein|nr:hypothetical protein [Prevotellaceae bacterium]
MKSKKYLCLLVTLSAALCCKAVDKKEVVLLADGVAYSVTYYSGESGCHVRNKSNKLYRISGDSLAQCLSTVKEVGISVKDIIKQLYSKEKIEQLAGKKATVGCIMHCNSSGDVLEVFFMLHNACIDELTLAKIKEMEDLFKAKYKLKFKFSPVCPQERKYYRLTTGLKFSQCMD